jgi:hypothetical protein
MTIKRELAMPTSLLHLESPEGVSLAIWFFLGCLMFKTTLKIKPKIMLLQMRHCYMILSAV